MKNNQIFNFAKKIIHFPRSLTGEGVRNTLKEVRNILPNLKIKSFKSGEKVFDWKIPLEWEVKDAFIINPEGKKICDYKDNKLHLVGYSIPVKKILVKKTFKKTLFSPTFN